MTDGQYTVEYALEFEDGSRKTYAVDIDKKTLISRTATVEPYPDWTRLDESKCDSCTLKDSDYCPIAVRLVEPLKQFGATQSFAPVTTTVVTPERTYAKQGDAQEALRSMFGLIMATSGCPLMQPFKYMARYHLPFSTIEETISRITSTYLLRQILTDVDQTSLPVDLKEIEGLYNTMQHLNNGIANRIKSATKNGDGPINAVIIFSTYSSLIPIIIRDELKKLAGLFEAKG